MNLTSPEKIARLPHATLEQLNQRLLDRQPDCELLAWLNALPETITLCQEHDGHPINPQNLADWRQDGHSEWLRRRELIQETGHQAGWSRQLAEADGGQLSEGAGAILAGHIIQLLESLARVNRAEPASAANADDSGEARWLRISKAVSQSVRTLAALRRVAHSHEQLELARQALQQRDQTLAFYREKFERQICRQLLDEGLRKKTEEIANTFVSYEDKIKAIRDVVFADIDEMERTGEVKALLPP